MFRSVLIAAACLAAVPAAAFELTSADVRDGERLPMQHVYPRCGGQNVSPELSWKDVPKDAKSLVLTMIDVGVVPPHGWSHWMIADLPPAPHTLAQGNPVLPEGARVLKSDFGDAAYAGPCPPPGTGVHRYQFTLWALGEAKLPNDNGSASLGAWLESHAIAKARLTATAVPKGE